MRSLLLVCASVTLSHASPAGPWDATTMARQGALGVAGGLVGSVAGGLFGSLFEQDRHGDPVLLGAIAGVVVGTTVGEIVAGDLGRGSTGHWWGGALGGVGSLAVFALAGYNLDKLEDLPGWAAAALAVGVMLAGPMIGYQLSAHRVEMPVATIRF